MFYVWTEHQSAHYRAASQRQPPPPPKQKTEGAYRARIALQSSTHSFTFTFHIHHSIFVNNSQMIFLAVFLSLLLFHVYKLDFILATAPTAVVMAMLLLLLLTMSMCLLCCQLRHIYTHFILAHPSNFWAPDARIAIQSAKYEANKTNKMQNIGEKILTRARMK